MQSNASYLNIERDKYANCKKLAPDGILARNEKNNFMKSVP